jgi:hypothetical protein
MKYTEQIECSKKLVFKLQAPVNHPEESIRHPLFLLAFNDSCIILADSKNPQVSRFMKIRPVGAELIHSEGNSDRRT